ncbi:MAG: methylmalonyl-CoA epimerase [Thaumarchaeota archaeon]|nr:methylmalonyl-CoA epimerase [Nitrososphaerota archaeon]MDE0526952.1 methylmalonyl-CoA epimerase [Nitrososphaerota archaeon]
MRIDHVAIAVNDLDEAARTYKEALGADSVEFETVESEGVRVGIIRMENGRIELMQPVGDSSPIKKFLDTRGQGLHHVALGTSDIEGEVGRMKDAGVRFLGDVRPGSEGTMVTFVHPKSLCGVLAELCSHTK